MRLCDFASHVHTQIAHVPHCACMQVFINIHTGSPYMACERSDLAEHWMKSKSHLFVGTYTRAARFSEILADLLIALDDADRQRLRTIELHEITGRACPH